MLVEINYDVKQRHAGLVKIHQMQDQRFATVKTVVMPELLNKIDISKACNKEMENILKF